MPLFQFSINDAFFIRNIAEKCERFVMGIPDDVALARLYGETELFRMKQAVEFWKDVKWVTEFIELTPLCMDYRSVYDTLLFDVILYGTRYGRIYEKDSEYFKSIGVTMVPMFPAEYNGNFQPSIGLALEDVRPDQDIILFGSDGYFEAYMNRFGKKYKPAYAIDNNAEKCGQVIQGVEIRPVDAILSEDPNKILVIICAFESDLLIKQLREIGDYNYRTMLYDKYSSMIEEYAIAVREESEYLDSCQPLLCTMLKEFDRICTSHGIKYYVAFGTLIGTLRHQGFIPWDDDIDVSMSRGEFNRLKAVLPEELNPEKYRFVDYDEIGGNAFLDCLPRIYDIQNRFPTKVFKKVRSKASKDLDGRLFLDIFVMDDADENPVKHKRQIFLLKLIYNLMMGHRDTTDYSEYAERFSRWQIFAMKLIHHIGAVIPLAFLSSCFDRISQRANGNQNSSDYLMTSRAITDISRRFPKRCFGEPKRATFADFDVMIPEDSFGLCNAIGYGDIMQYPPCSIRKPSHYFNSDIELWK